MGIGSSFTLAATQVGAQATTQAFTSTAAASAAGPAVGAAAIGSAIGSGLIAVGIQVGLSYAFPNVSKVEGRRIGEIPLGFTSEGAPIPLSFGPSNRLAGTIIYASKLKEKKLVEEIDTSGISSGDYQELTTYNYSMDLAIAVGEGEISNVRKIWADGVPIWRHIDARPEQTGTTLSVEKVLGFGGFLPILLRLKSSTNSIDLTEWTTPSLIDISGFANAGNNLIAGVVRRAHVDPTDANITFLDIWSLLVGLTVTEAEGATVTIVQSFSQVPGFNFFRVGKTADAITIYKGDDSQGQNIFLEASRLPESLFPLRISPAYRHTAYVYFDNLKLDAFNDRVPRLEFLVEKATTQTLGDTISTLLERGGIPARNIDVSDIQDTNINGYTIFGPTAMMNAIQPLIQAFNLVAFEVDGKLTFKHRENATVIPLVATELAAHSTDGDAPRALDITDVASFNLPKTVNVNYLDLTNSMQKGNHQERRVNATVDTSFTLDFPITMTTAKASEIASRFLWGAWINRQSVSFTLPPSRLTLNETEIVTVTSGGNKFRIIVTEIKRGHDYRLECLGVIESIESLNFSPTVDEVDIGPVDQDPSGDSLIAIGFIDIAPLSNSHVNTSGAYFALTDYDRLGGWQGGQLYIGTTDITDSGLSLAIDVPNESIMGISVVGEGAGGVLADGDTETWDITNTVAIVLFNGQLTTITRLQVLEGQNIALLGDEIIAFSSAFLQEDGTYTLSGLLRGLRGTQSKTTTHALFDRFIPLKTGNIAYYGISSDLISSTLGMKAISVRAALADVPLHTHTFNAGAATPFAPAQVEGTRNGSNDITVTWERVTTKRWKQFGSQPFPANEFGDELYTVEYRDGSDVLKFTETDVVGPARTATATAAQHGEGASSVKVQVFHQGTLVALGSGSTSITVT